MDVKKMLDYLEEFYNNISDSELRLRLEKSGFQILDDAPGQIVFEEEKPDFILTGIIKYIATSSVEYDFSLLGVAS